MEPYDSVRLMAHAIDLAESFHRWRMPIVAALETIDVSLLAGTLLFRLRVSHNPEMPEGTPDLFVAPMARSDRG